jgi:hypothetical protein
MLARTNESLRNTLIPKTRRWIFLKESLASVHKNTQHSVHDSFIIMPGLVHERINQPPSEERLAT